MRRVRFGSADEVPESTYVELVGSLFATHVPTAIMSGLFAITGLLIWMHSRDAVLMGLLAAGILSSIVRIAVLIREGRRLASAANAAGVSASVERRFAASYLLFAAILGAFGARVLALPDRDLHMLAAILLVGYAAGAAAGTALRPRISILSLLLATLPAAAVMGLTPDLIYRTSAVTLLAFLAGGIRSLVERYTSQAAKITRRHVFSTLARIDHLTGLPNRLALIERFERIVADQKATRLAVHCLDLDGFKPVNDRFGHPTGDALLIAVADRMRAIARGDDVVARLGGDEFVFVQTGIRQDHEAATMATRLEQVLSEPYHQAGRITVGASVGYCVQARKNAALDELIGHADEMLLRRKAERKRPPLEAAILQIGGVRAARQSQ